MKNIFLLLTLFFAEAVFGQAINPFETIKRVEADGITFEVKRSKYTFTVNNVANHYVDRAGWCYKDGRELETEEEYASVNAVRSRSGQNRALREAFGDDVIKALRVYKDSPMSIFYAIGPDGTTLEVSFSMNAKPELLALPMTAFAALEKKLKEYVTWELNDFAKQLEFFHSFNFVFFESVLLESETSQRDPKFDYELKPDPGKPFGYVWW